MEENVIPKKKIIVDSEDEKYLVTSINVENDKEYFLYSDGNLYVKDNTGNLKRLDNVTPESKALIKKIMENFKPGKTDVVKTEKSDTLKKKEIDVDYPEL